MENTVNAATAESELSVPPQAPPKKKPRSRVEKRENLVAFLFILPPVVGFLIFTAISMGCTFVFSFQNYYVRRGTSEFVGFTHYVSLFSGMFKAG